ncbi:MAG TPA: peptide-methionine (S)-S-oxide reductase MsrA [Xanthomonadaceae bacterium]|nr:peptide-methionine (S)-S-oxide reductase MsrA [Xanthomonadaceae bacterium]
MSGARLASALALLLLAPALARTAQDTAPQSQRVEVATGLAVATFAGGCFWCMEPPFDKLPGVVSTVSGYIGGTTPDPTYREVSAGGTGHAEAVQITYDPDKVDYATLLEVFWRNVDPFAVDRQFCDVGSQYRSAIFVDGSHERELAEASRQTLQERFGKPIATTIESASTFHPAEDYHQDYYLKNPVRYRYYRWNCARDQRLEQIWGSEP